MEEPTATLTEAHTRQMENLVRSTTEAMNEMMLCLKENKNTNINVTNEEKRKKKTRKTKEIQLRTNLQALWQETSITR
jgi:hypothetical protein